MRRGRMRASGRSSFVFFFSSRRRHTRCLSDWSSDVCSSDLWSKADLPGTTIHNATNVALAIANNGVVGFLYQQLSGGRWVTHLVQSHDGFTTSQDTVLATVPADQPAEQFLPYLGDYDYLLSAGNEFRGVFCANNTPNFADFPHGVTFQRAADFGARTLNDGAGNLVPISIDPFYFSVPVIP